MKAEEDRLKSEMDSLLARLSKIKPVSTNKETFTLPLPGPHWEDFAGSQGIAFWRQVPTGEGRAIEFKFTGPFDFGRHSHPLEERFTMIAGCCLFGIGEMQYLEPGESLTMGPEKIHSLRVLKAGLALVHWPDLTADEIEITIE